MVWFVSNTNEVNEGTARILLKYVYYHLVVQIVYALFGLLVMGLIFDVVKIFTSGIWPVYFVFLTITSMENPEGFTR